MGEDVCGLLFFVRSVRPGEEDRIVLWIGQPSAIPTIHITLLVNPDAGPGLFEDEGGVAYGCVCGNREVCDNPGDQDHGLLSTFRRRHHGAITHSHYETPSIRVPAFAQGPSYII